MKTVVYAPGHGQGPEDRSDDVLLEVFQGKGYQTRRVPINWCHTTVPDWEQQICEMADAIPPHELVLAGFSAGALATVRAARYRRGIAGLWLFSLSPYFLDDLPHIPPSPASSMVCYGQTLHSTFGSNAIQIDAAQAMVFAGTHDARNPGRMMSRAYRAAEVLPAELHIIPGARHDPTDKPYLQAIQQYIPPAVAELTA